MNKRRKLAAWVIASCCFMVAIQLFISLAVKSDKKFDVVYSQPVDREGYQDEPAAVRVYAAPALKWAEAPTAGKTFGFILWALIPLAGWYVGTDRYHGKTKVNDPKPDKGWFGLLIFLVPVVLSIVFYIAAYSASLDQGSLVITYDEFITRFQIDQETARKIVNEGGAGTSIRDANGLLTAYFTGK